MAVRESTYYEQVLQELEQFPSEYLPTLLKMLRAFRESVTPKNAEDGFKQAWREAMNGETLPLSELWTDIDAE
jgi:hypothetical protein